MWFGKGVVLVDVNRFACAAAFEGETEFAKAANFLHDVRRAVSCGYVDFFIAIVGFAKEVALLEFL